MDEGIEMTDLSSRPSQNSQGIDVQPSPATPLDDAVASWSWATALILFCSGLCLTIYPRFLLFISESNDPAERRTALTPLESFLCLHSGIWIIALTITLVINLPDSPDAQKATSTSLGHPLLIPLTLTSTTTALLAYNSTEVGTLATIVALGSATIGLWGFWVILFGGSSSISKKTGADKRTSAFLFSNKTAASSQKRLWKKAQRNL